MKPGAAFKRARGFYHLNNATRDNPNRVHAPSNLNSYVVVVVVVVDDVDFLVLVTDPAGRREQEPEDVGVSPRRRLHRDGPAVARLQPEVRAAS